MMVGPVPAGTPGPAGPPGRQPRGRALAPQGGYSPAGATRRARPLFKRRPSLAPPSYRGPSWAASDWRRAKPARGPAGPTGQGRGPSPRGGPPDAAGADKMQGRPRPKGIKAGPCILPLHFGRGCGMALPPPRPADRPRDDRWRRPPKRNKGACAGWRPAAPGASVPGVSAVEWLG